ncbi:MAG: hypothetical protein WBO44_03315 [Saprospiraceae bacterium]
MVESRQELIERYFLGELSNLEKADFEKNLAEDPVLLKEFEAYRLSLGAIKLYQREILNKRFRELDRNRYKNAWIFWILAVLTLVFLLFLINQRKSVSKEDERVNAVSDTAQLNPTNSETMDSMQPLEKQLPEKELPKENTIQRKSNPEKRNTESQIITMDIVPYRGDELNYKVRGVEELSVYDQFMMAYWLEEYNKVLELFEKLNPGMQFNGNVLFIKANALLGLKKYKEAKSLFKKVSENRNARYAILAKQYYEKLNQNIN